MEIKTEPLPKRRFRAELLTPVVRTAADNIRSGRWREGMVLPSLRALSAEYKVSHETVRRALQALENEGLVRKVQGRGTLVAGPDHKSAPGRTVTFPSTSSVRVLTLHTSEYASVKRRFWDEAARLFGERAGEVKIRMAGMADPLEQAGVESADIVHAPAWQIREMGARGRLLNLQPWVEQEPVHAGGALTGFDARGTDPCWGIPIAFDLRVVYLNLALVTEAELAPLDAAWSLDTLAAWAAARSRKKGASRPMLLPWPHVLAGLCGLDPMNPAALESNLCRLPDVLERLGACNRVYPLYEPSLFDGDLATRAYQEFIGGHAPVVFHHTFSIAETVERMKGPWAVRPLPTCNGQGPAERVTLSCAVSRRCACPEGAMEFIRFLAGPAGQTLMARNKTNIPMSRQAAESAEFQTPPPAGLGLCVRNLGPTTEMALHGGRSFQIAYSLVWDQEILGALFGGYTPAQACARIRARGTALIRAFGLA